MSQRENDSDIVLFRSLVCRRTHDNQSNNVIYYLSGRDNVLRDSGERRNAYETQPEKMKGDSHYSINYNH